MANGLFDFLGGLGTTPPSYMEGLLGAQATEDLRKRSIGSGLVNALIGYAAAPKDQNLGLGRILASAAQSGLAGARGVYDTATQDFQTQAKIEEMKRQRALADRDLSRQTQMEGLASQLFTTTPAQYRDVQTPPSFMPTPAMEGDVAPNFNLQAVENPPTREMISPESRTINMDTLQKYVGLSKDPLAALKTSAELVPALQRAGFVQSGQQDNPFDIFAESELPQVRKLAQTYRASYANNRIGDDKALVALNQLATMEDRGIARADTAEARKAEADRSYDLRQQLANNTISQAQFNQQMAQNAQAMRQDNLDFKREEASRKGQKVLPEGALKRESANIATAYETIELADNINNQIQSLITNKVDFSPTNNARLAVQSFAGATTPEVLAYNDFNRFKVKLVNDSLRLNKGVQTEGDAIRAAKELSNAKSTADAVAAMQKLRDINAKNAKVTNQIISSSRKSGGLTEERGYAPPEQVPVPTYENVYFSEKDAGFKALPKGTIFIDGTTGQRKRK